jgi:Outer membrane protein beta-barrel domain
MKILLPFAFILCCFSVLNAQEKFQWGFLLRGGNYALPVETRPAEYKAKIQPGYFVNTGVFAQINITQGMGFSTEFAYSMAKFQKKFSPSLAIDCIGCDIYRYAPNHRYTQQSFMLPMKFHFNNRPTARFSFFAGGGPFFAWFTEQQIIMEEDGVRFFTGEYKLYEDYKNYGRDVRWQWFLNTGFSVRVCERTRIGVEAFFNPRSQSSEFFYDEEYPVLLRNISLSLYHRAR